MYFFFSILVLFIIITMKMIEWIYFLKTNTTIKGDQLETDLDAIRAIITEKSKENIFCVMSTTRFIFHDSYLMSINFCQCKHSCFAPRGADDVEAIARLCKELDIPHIVNNAYGIQVINIDCILNKITHHSLLLLFFRQVKLQRKLQEQ